MFRKLHMSLSQNCIPSSSTSSKPLIDFYKLNLTNLFHIFLKEGSYVVLIFKMYLFFERIIYLYSSKFRRSNGYIVKINVAFTQYSQLPDLPRDNHIKCTYCLPPFLSLFISTNSCYFLQCSLLFFR